MSSVLRQKKSDAKQAAYERKIAELRACYLKKHSGSTQQSKKAKSDSWVRIKKAIPHLISVLPSRSQQELFGIYQNCAKRMVGRNSAEISPPVLELHGAILREWERRTSSLLADEGYFDWPTTEAAKGDGSLSGHAWHSTGMLSALGYHVGTTEGLPEVQRQFALDQVFSIPLPPLNGPAYMAEWGKPATARRLKKLAETIAALARNAKRRKSHDLLVACEEWEVDLEFLYNLEFLYKKYYLPRFRFTWPVV